MNSQDIRNLQEAYLDVYYELDEGRGDDLRTKHGLKPGEVSTELSKRAEIKALNIGRRTHFDRERSDSLLRLSGLSKERSQGETPAGNSRWNSEGQLRDIRSRGGRPSNRYDAGAGRDRGNIEQRLLDWASGKRNHPNMTDSERRFAHHNRYADPYAVRNEQVNLYDIILSHLLDEGYAETLEQAEVIMVNMSEDWRDSICENVTSGKGRVRNIQSKPTGLISNTELNKSSEKRKSEENIRINTAGDEAHAKAITNGMSFSDAQTRRTAAQVRARREIERSYR
jgi:hypothetical protein